MVRTLDTRDARPHLVAGSISLEDTTVAGLVRVTGDTRTSGEKVRGRERRPRATMTASSGEGAAWRLEQVLEVELRRAVMSVGMERPVTCSASSTTSRLGLWAWISCTQQQLLQTTISVLHSHLQSSRGLSGRRTKPCEIHRG